MMRNIAWLVRRFFVIAGLMYWQGGFVFYAAIVVPIGGEVLGSPERQAVITRQVAQQINWTGIGALILFGSDILATQAGRWLRRVRWASWFGMLACQIVLFAVYPRLDRLFHGSEAFLEDHAAFRPWHRAYLWVSTGLFGFAVVFTIATLLAWRRQDCHGANVPEGGHVRP